MVEFSPVADPCCMAATAQSAPLLSWCSHHRCSHQQSHI